MYRQGWDAVRNKRYEKMVDEGFFTPEQNVLSPRTEIHNVAEQNPEMVEMFSGKWQMWAMKTNVFPKPATANK